MQQNTTIKYAPIVHVGLILGIAYVLSQYIFYFGGRSVLINSSFNSVIHFITIIGLYFGLSHFRRIYTKLSFGKLLFFGLIVSFIAIIIKIIFSAILYDIIAPDLGGENVRLISDTISSTIDKMSNITQKEYKTVIANIISPLSIAFFEGISLFITAFVFSLFIAGLHSIFRK